VTWSAAVCAGALAVILADAAFAETTAGPAKESSGAADLSPEAKAAVATVLGARPHLARGDPDGRELAQALARAQELLTGVAAAPEAESEPLRALVAHGPVLEGALDRLRVRTDLAPTLVTAFADADTKCQTLLGRIAEVAVASTPEARQTAALAALEELRQNGLRGPLERRGPIRPTFWNLGSRR